jgi:hypothetical protein
MEQMVQVKGEVSADLKRRAFAQFKLQGISFAAWLRQRLQILIDEDEAFAWREPLAKGQTAAYQESLANKWALDADAQPYAKFQPKD